MSEHSITKSWQNATLQDFAAIRLTKERAADFQNMVKGQVVWPWDARYHQARQGHHVTHQEYPAVVVYCETEADVAQCLQIAQELSYPVTCRSGGHNTAGYAVNTSGIVIDTRGLNYIQLDVEKHTAQIGPGANFGEINAILNEHKLHIPGGNCEHVCVAGYMQGGGYGYTSRQFGMNCDNVLQIRMMLTDGCIVIANAEDNADLYWAVRGGTGNNFGVLLNVTYQLHVLDLQWGFRLCWSLDEAPPVLYELQNNYMKTGAPTAFGYTGLIMMQEGETEPHFLLCGIYDGDRESGMVIIEALLKIGHPTFQMDEINSYAYLNRETMPGPNFPANTFSRQVKQSGYIARPMPLEGWQALVHYFATTDHHYSNAIFFEPYGGAINTTAPYANAFIHRDAYLDIYIDAFWFDDGGQSAAETWLDGYLDLLAPYFNGHQYQNYPRRNVKNYQWAYWGEAYAALALVKAKYDPENRFNFPLGIAPASQEDWAALATTENKAVKVIRPFLEQAITGTI